MKKVEYYTTILIIVLMHASCFKKDDVPSPIVSNPTQKEEQLPPPTTVGAGTFGCRINGKPWVAKTNKSGWAATYASFARSYHNKIKIIGMIELNNQEAQVIIMTYYHTNNSDYPLFLRGDGINSGEYRDDIRNIHCSTDSIVGGHIYISRFDTLRQIVSGTFHFDCVNRQTLDTMRITDGRFDMHYIY